MVYVEHVLGPSCAYVGPRSAYVRPMLAKVGPRLASVRLMSANVGPMLSNLGGYVGHMLVIFGLRWGNVRQLMSPTPTKCRISLSARHA